MAINHNPVICGALRENGKTCQRVCKPGFTKCYMHGGQMPAAKAKAEHMLALLRMPAMEAMQNALETLNDMIDQFNEITCASCGYPKADVEEREAIIKACLSAVKTGQTILDRTGMGPTAKLEVRQTDGTIDLKSLTDDERARMIGILGELRGLKTEIRQRLMAGEPGGTKTLPAQEPPQIM